MVNLLQSHPPFWLTTMVVRTVYLNFVFVLRVKTCTASEDKRFEDIDVI